MSAPDNRNWFGDIQCFDGPAQAPRSEREVIAILRDRQRYPSPVRPMGSRHSMTACMASKAPGEPARWGTGVDLRNLTALESRPGERLWVDRQAGTVTVPAGRTFYSIAHELRDASPPLQLRVNTELGTLTMGAGACGATKDSSFPGEPGQVCSDVVAMRLVRPDGEVQVLREGEPDFDALRCSYGLFGIVTEVTFRVYPLQYIAISHEELELEQFEARSREWLAAGAGNAVFLYLFPYATPPRIVAELRRKLSAQEAAKPRSESVRLSARNFFWRKGLHRAAEAVRAVPDPVQAEPITAAAQKLTREFLKSIDLDAIDPVAQIVDFERGSEKFTFSMWAFPAAEFPRVLAEYFRFCQREAGSGFRTALPHVSYHISEDRSSLLSYSYDGDVWTLDPIASGVEPGWQSFLEAFNESCSAWGGVPLFNQTPFLQRRHVARAFGDRLTRFEAIRRRFDPDNRMLNDYFAGLLPD